ncbi:MAG TPA: hypothetical protein VMB51_13905 [Solirubrobacteraceae bacterium]|nr:hypothetical protein [Solirubrobacteraceae bacterium]
MRWPARALWAGLGLSVAWLVLLLACCASASALAARGHVFAFAFEGENEHAFTSPSAVAVDEASGELFVVGPVHERVQRFRPETGGEAGYEFAGEWKVNTPGAIAVDNAPGSESQGDVYVAGAKEKAAEPYERDLVEKFTASGEPIYKKSVFKGKEGGETCEVELEDIDGLAVDGKGRLWAYWEEDGDVSGFGDGETNKCIPALQAEEPLERVEEVGGEPCLARDLFAVAPGDEAFYMGHEKADGLDECSEEPSNPSAVAELSGSSQTGPAGAVTSSIEREDATGLAVDATSGDVYVDTGTSVAELAPDGRLVQRFGEGVLSGGGAVAVDHASEEVFVAEEHQIVVFAPEAAGAPSIDGVYAQALSASTGSVTAQIDPHGLSTEYEVVYGTVSCEGEPTPCTGRVSGTIPAGYGDAQVQAQLSGLEADTTYYYRVLAHNGAGSAASGLAARTFFTTLPSSEAAGLLDAREWELVSPAAPHGAAAEPISREGALIQASAGGNAISWTATAPVSGEAQGNRRVEPLQVLSRRSSEGWASEDITTPHDRGEGINSGEATEYRFFSPDLSEALVQPQVPQETLEDPPLAPEATEKTIYLRNDAGGGGGGFVPLVTAADDLSGVPFGGKLEFAGANPDLGAVVFSSEVPLVQDAGEAGLYEWRQGAASLEALSVLPGGEAAGEAELGGFEGHDLRGAVSDNGEKVFWTDGTSTEPDRGGLYMTDTQTGESVHVNATQGAGTSEPSEEELGEGLDQVSFQAATGNGERVFFTDTWPLTSESTLEPVGEGPLVEGQATGHPADLYEYNTETGQLTDLTPDQRVGESADVLGAIAGISENGQYAYFIANGALAPGAEPGDCPRIKPLTPKPQAQCNLYVSEANPEHLGEHQTRLIARLSYEDAPDWAGGNSPLPGDLGGLTAQVSANGRYLAFMSDEQLTGYDNTDLNPEAHGAHDEEVYLYDAAQGRLVCASCNPSGQQPQGVYDTENAGEGLGLTVDRPETWTGRWLAGSLPGWTLFELTNPIAEHQSRYLSNNGRLFFNATGPLLPTVASPARPETVNGNATSVGVENVYEYEPRDEGSCVSQPGCVALVSSGTSTHESSFLDASENGDDAFFLTNSQLVPQASENAPAVYDARVCGTAQTEPCLPTVQPALPRCTGEAGCRPAAPQAPTFSPAASSTSTGPGNPPAKQQVSSGRKASPKPLTRSQKLALALKACHKLKRHARRLGCERSARKRYGTKAKRKNKHGKVSELRHDTATRNDGTATERDGAATVAGDTVVGRHGSERGRT